MTAALMRSFLTGLSVTRHRVIVSTLALIALTMSVDAGAQSSQPRPRVGVAFAAGMSADELSQLLDHTNWDEMFGFSSFQYKNLRRKQDARNYPSRIELG